MVSHYVHKALIENEDCLRTGLYSWIPVFDGEVKNFNKVNPPQTKGYEPEPRPTTGGNPAPENTSAPEEKTYVPPSNYAENLGTSKSPADATPAENARNIKPFEHNVFHEVA